MLRLVLSPLAFNGDLLTNAGWGEWIYENGALGFYENTQWLFSWPNQPPLLSYIYGLNFVLYQKLLAGLLALTTFIAVHRLAPTYFLWLFDFVSWFGNATFGSIDYKYGFLTSMKLIPIISDLVIFFLIFFLGRKIANIKRALLVGGLYLFLPFSWYLSSLWGQYDQLGTLLALASFLFLYNKRFVLSALFFFLTIYIKPPLLLLSIFYAFLFFSLKPSFKATVFSAMAALAAAWVTTSPFTTGNPILYVMQTVIPKVLYSGRFSLANHTFNLWQFLAPFGGATNAFTSALGALFLIAVNAAGVLIVLKKKDLKTIFAGLYVVAAGSYLFGTGMVDRYLFPAVLFLGILTFYFPKLLKWWISTALLFSLNLFYTWGFPIIPENEGWKNASLIRIGSVAQTGVFFAILKELKVSKSVEIKSLKVFQKLSIPERLRGVTFSSKLEQ